MCKSRAVQADSSYLLEYSHFYGLVTLEVLCAHTGALHDSSASSDDEGPSEQAWADAFAQALLALQKYSRAQRGDRTMLDALIPAQQAFSDSAHSGPSLDMLWKHA